MKTTKTLFLAVLCVLALASLTSLEGGDQAHACPIPPAKRAAAPACVPSEPIGMNIPAGMMRGEFRGVQSVSFDKDGVSVVVGAGILAHEKGRMSFKRVSVGPDGEICDTKNPDPHAGCTTIVTIENNRATIKCQKQDECTTACGLNSFVDANGVTAWLCECNLR